MPRQRGAVYRRVEDAQFAAQIRPIAPEQGKSCRVGAVPERSRSLAQAKGKAQVPGAPDAVGEVPQQQQRAAEGRIAEKFRPKECADLSAPNPPGPVETHVAEMDAFAQDVGVGPQPAPPSSEGTVACAPQRVVGEERRPAFRFSSVPSATAYDSRTRWRSAFASASAPRCARTSTLRIAWTEDGFGSAASDSP